MQDFHKLRVYDSSHEFLLDLYKVLGDFPAREEFALSAQLRRASVSVVSCIAEGTGTESQKHFRRYLFSSLGSAKEIEAQLKIALDLGYIKKDAYERLLEKLVVLEKQLSALIKSLEGGLK